MLGVQDAVFVLWGGQLDNSTWHVAEALAAYLACSVDDLSRIVLSIVLDDPTEGVLDCRVIALDEVVFDKADCKR